MDANLALYEL